MIPPATHPMWAKLIKGEVRHQFAVASAGLLTFNLQQKLRKEPGSMPMLIAEARAFFSRYEVVFAGDLAKLFG